MADNVPDVYVYLDGLKGECTDETHPGKDGWFQIKGFSFGFGLKGGEAKASAPPAKPGHAPAPAAAPPAGGKKKAKDDGPFDHPEVTLNKTFDMSSPGIWENNCHAGQVIPKIEVRACRYGN